MPSTGRIALLGLVLCLLAVAPAAPVPGDPAPPEGSSPRIFRWESDLSAGSVSSGRLGIVKSFWWYAVPKVVAVGLSLDHVLEAIPLLAQRRLERAPPRRRAVRLRRGRDRPDRGGITHYGGGIKVRLGRRLGVVAEYRRYHYRQSDGTFDPILHEGGRPLFRRRDRLDLLNFSAPS